MCEGRPTIADQPGLLGNGDGTFGPPASFPSGIAQVAVALDDVNRDGRVDVVLVGGGGSPIGNRNLSILFGLGDGTFAAPVTGNSGTDPIGLLLADFNGDGYLDIASDSKQWGTQADTPMAVDIDADGKTDLMVWHPATGEWRWLTSYSGYLASGTRQWGSSASWVSTRMSGLIPMNR